MINLDETYFKTNKKYFKIVLVIIGIIVLLFIGWLIRGNFTLYDDKNITNDDYVNANLNRLDIKINNILEKQKCDIEYIANTVKYINNELQFAYENLEKIKNYKEILHETSNNIDYINSVINDFRPSVP